MDCATVERENIIERYLAGRLDPALKEEWELHYFGCDKCASHLETWQALQVPLRDMDAEIRRDMGRAKPHFRPVWMIAGLAAALLLGFGLSRMAQRTRVGAPQPEIQEVERAQRLQLARIEPPAYHPPVLRGTESEAERKFQDAMQFYQRRDYPQAIAGLKAALESDSTAPAPRFFLGACLVLSGNLDDGVSQLRAVADGNSPFAEEAAFDLAKADLQRGDRAAAIDELHRVSSLNGDFKSQADRLIAQLQAGQ